MPMGQFQLRASRLLGRDFRARGARYGLVLAAAAVIGAASRDANAAVVDTWTGAANGNWDTASVNWSNGGSGLYTDGDTVIFSGGSNTAITVQAAGVSPASTTFQSTSNNYSFTNASGTTGLNGAGTLTLASTYTGAVTLNSANAFTGATTINGGKLELRNASAIAGSALSINSGGTLSLRADADTTFNSASLAGLTTNGTSRTIQVNSLNSPSGDGKTLTLTASGTLAGTTGTSASPVALNVSSTTGDTLSFGKAFTLTGTGGGSWASDAFNFNLQGANMVLNGLAQSGVNGGITVSSSTGNSLTINGVVSSSTNRTIYGQVNSGATLVLNNTVTRSGSNQGFFVYLNGGTLDVNNAGAIANNSGISGTRAGLAINGGVLDNTSGSAKTLSASPTVLLNGDFTFSTSGATTANDLNLGTGAASLGPAAGTARTITVNGSSTLTIGGAIADGTTATGITKAGTGTLALAGTNTFSGATTVQNGTLSLGASGTIASNLILGVSGGTSGTLDVTSKTSYSQANVSGNGTINIGSSKTVTVTGSLAPGFSTGQINVTGNLGLGTSTTMEVAGTGGVAGTSFDYVNATGGLAYGGALTISNSGAFVVTAQNGSYNLFDFTSQSGSFGSVSVAGTALSQSGSTWTGHSGAALLTFDQSNGVLTVNVPEPATAGAMLLAGASLIRRRRRSA